jgi:hypothetical protein
MPRLSLLGLLAVLLCGCSQFRGDLRDKFALRSPLIHGETSTDANRVPYIAAKAREFAAAHQAAAARPTDPLAISRYVGTGITYSQLLCADYFDRQVYAQAHRNFARSEMNLSAGLASTLLGLAKASATGVAATGALFSFTEASFDAFDGAYLVSPELADLERLVREKLREEEVVIYRKLYADAASTRWPDRVETLDQAERVLGDYVFHCTFNGMKVLLAASIKNRSDAIGQNVRELQSGDEVNKPASQLKQQ